MPVVPCPAEGCNFQTEDFEASIAVELLKIHALSHTATQAAPGAAATTHVDRQKPPKLYRPSISRGTTEEEWSIIIRKWSIYKTTTNIPADQVATHLWQCCDDELTSDIFRDVSDIASISEDDLLEAIKRLAVVSVATTVRKTELLSLRQDHGQPIRLFAAKVKGKAHTCDFKKACSATGCTAVVDYTEDIVKFVMLSGIVDEDIKRDILGFVDLDNKSLTVTIALIEGKEMAARAMKSDIARAAPPAHVAANFNKRPQVATLPPDICEKLLVKINGFQCSVEMNRYRNQFHRLC